MRDIEPTASFGVMVGRDVEATLNGLRKGERYSASDLYDRYSDVAKEAGHNPGHKVAFGQALARLGLTRAKMTVGGPGAGRGRSGRGRQVVAWMIPWDFQ